MVQPSLTFAQEEFSREDFDAAEFVLKYKDIASLQELRDSLRFYAEQLKRQLYDLINQDYKDFITISTQLDGVDDRVEHLRRPLADLRLELYTIQDNLTSSIQVINAKLEEKKQLSRRRVMIESSLRCMDNLQAAEELLGLATAHALSPTNETEDGKRRRNRKDVLKSASRKHVPFGLSIDVLECSTLEQAAHAVRAAKDDAGIHRGAPTEESAQAISKLVGLRKMLEARATTVRDALVHRIYERLTQMVTPAGMQSVNERSLAYCLRALAVLGDGAVAERWMAETLMAPFLQSHLTQGRIDGPRRGSFGGLKEVFDQILQHVQSVCLPVVQLSETLFGTACTPPVDFIVRGIWAPIYEAIMRVIGVKLFTVGVASTMHSNFTNCMYLLQALANLLGDEHHQAVHTRLLQDPRWNDFKDKWNLPLYYQLRTTEIGVRFETALHFVTINGLSSNCTREVYDKSASGVGATASSPTLSLSLETLQKLRSDSAVPEYGLPICTVLSTEIATCWHKDVYLAPLGARFTKLTLQLFHRFESWVLTAADQSSTHESSGTNPAAQQGPGRTNAVLLTAPVSELAMLTTDLTLMRQWTHKHVVEMIKSHVHATAALEINSIDEAFVAVDEALETAQNRVWVLIAEALAAECSNCFSAVQHIAVNFRMTRKPAPTAPSNYVDSIMLPVTQFMSDYSSEAFSKFLPTIAENVCKQYLANVTSLLETARRMDTVIQRRARGKKQDDLMTEHGPSGAKRAASSDSDKILLQAYLDVRRFGEQLEQLGLNLSELRGFQALQAEVSVAEEFVH